MSEVFLKRRLSQSHNEAIPAKDAIKETGYGEQSVFCPMESWVNRHKSFKQAIEGQHDFKVIPPTDSPAARLQAYNEVTTELQGIIAQAVKRKKTLRAQGSSWSLSKVAVTDHELIDTKPLRIGFKFPPAKRRPAMREIARSCVSCSAGCRSRRSIIFCSKTSCRSKPRGRTMVRPCRA